MRAVIQRVSRASVTVEGNRVSEIGNGLLILLGIGPEDDEEKSRAMTKKIAALRIFQDEADKMNLSVRDVNGSAIVVSQFTLYADCRKGNRPSFVGAAAPSLASPLVDRFVELLEEQGVPSQTGVFGAHMDVDLLNSGPVTIILDM
ncbi:MAG: D-tyrosyl-tRNA(Tyr) deacylase [Anaerolineaceae bacterium]|nr:D-tyrosyl-tRNA(Tyr) deacylase [Anaerolineaceae bacterium]